MQISWAHLYLQVVQLLLFLPGMMTLHLDVRNQGSPWTDKSRSLLRKFVTASQGHLDFRKRPQALNAVLASFVWLAFYSSALIVSAHLRSYMRQMDKFIEEACMLNCANPLLKLTLHCTMGTQLWWAWRVKKQKYKISSCHKVQRSTPDLTWDGIQVVWQSVL